nr:MAG TPA: coat protein [Caudoviricetes sp.]
MANQFIEVKEIARQLLPRLIENLVFPNLVYKDYSGDFVKGKGAKIQVKKPVVLKAEDFEQEKGTTPQDVVEDSVEVALDKFATVDVDFTSIQMVTNVDDLNRLFLEPAAVALAEKINADGLELYKDIPYCVGTAGTTPSTLDDIADARKMLNINKVPIAGRVAIWDPEADANFTTIPAIVNAEKSGSTQALREGSIGRVMGLENYMAQGIKVHEAGSLAGTTGIKASAETNAGLDTITLSKDSLTGNVKKGDIINIAKNNYVVTEDATASTNSITVKLYPALKTKVTTTDTIKIEKGHTANLAFNPNAFAFVTRPLAAPSGVEAYTTSYNGITLRVVKGYDMKTKKEMLSMDVLYGYKTMYPELATRILG